MADASSARMASAGKTLLVLRRAHAELALTNRDCAHTVLQDIGLRGRGCGLYLDLDKRLKQVFNTWRSWVGLEREPSPLVVNPCCVSRVQVAPPAL